jgi:hypothetical protein
MPGIAKERVLGSTARSTLLLILCAVLSVSARAETQADYMSLVTQYVQRLNNIYDGTWAYTVTVDDRRKDEVRVRRMDPSAADFRDRDRLISVNANANASATARGSMKIRIVPTSVPASKRNASLLR